MLGSDKDPTWRDFPLALTEIQRARHYVTLFEALFEASVLSDHENNALRASSLMAIPPPPPGMGFLAGLNTVDLTGASLTQWASYIQDVTSGMRMPLEAAVNCPQEDIKRVLNRLEMLTLLKYCCLCFGIGNKCRCTKVLCQTPSQGSALWTPLTMSYATMASPIMTTASTPVGGVPPLGYPLPGPPPGDPVLMDMLLAPSTENLLATATVGRGWRSPCKQLYLNYANCWKLVFSSSYAGCFLPCLLVLLFLHVGSLRLFWGMVVRGCARRDLCKGLTFIKNQFN